MSRTLFTSRNFGDLKVTENRDSLQRLLSLNSLRFMKQSHSDLVQIVDGAPTYFAGDALVTNRPGIGLCALAADCMPVTFSADGVVGVAHVGRVGLLKGVALRTVEMMRELGAGEIAATIGPSICADCYEVSPAMYHEAIALLPACATNEELHALNLQAGLTAQLVPLGVRVTDLGICTKERGDYFSFRGGDLEERQAGVISL